MGKVMRGLVGLIMLGCFVDFPAYAVEEPPLSGRPYALAEKAYSALSKGDVDEAGRAVDEALHEQPNSRQLGFLRLDIFMRKGDLASAQKLADDLVRRFPNDAQVLVQRGYFEQRRKLYQDAMNDFYAALGLPAGITDAAQQRWVRLSWADCALLSKQPKVALDALTPYANENDAAVQLRMANAHWSLGEREATHHSAELAEKAAKSDSERDAAHQLWVASGPVVLSDLDQAYAKLQAKNDAEAVQLFKRAFAKTPGTVYQYLDAGYAAKRSNDSASEVEWFSRALDIDAQLQTHVLDEQQRFNYRRNNQETDRSFGAVASLVYQGNGIGPMNNFNVTQMGVEAYWRPEGEGNRNGKLFNVFVRGFENVWDGSGGAVGEQTVQGDVGVRYKPLTDLNAILVVDKMFRIGNAAIDDLVLRFAYSDGSGGDLSAAQKSWPTWSIYTDGSYFTTTPQYIQTYEARFGRSWRLDSLNDRVSITPHLVVSGDYESLAAQPSSLGYGPGISMRGWFREDAHHAPASWLDLTVQYRFEVTQTNRAHGLGVRATLLY